jgi:hypothetical protein
MLVSVQTLLSLGLTIAEIDQFVIGGWTLNEVYLYMLDQDDVQAWDEYDEYLAELENAYP